MLTLVIKQHLVCVFIRLRHIILNEGNAYCVEPLGIPGGSGQVFFTSRQLFSRAYRISTSLGDYSLPDRNLGFATTRSTPGYILFPDTGSRPL